MKKINNNIFLFLANSIIFYYKRTHTLLNAIHQQYAETASERKWRVFNPTAKFRWINADIWIVWYRTQIIFLYSFFSLSYTSWEVVNGELIHLYMRTVFMLLIASDISAFGSSSSLSLVNYLTLENSPRFPVTQQYIYPPEVQKSRMCYIAKQK